jgi:hypothetical protein
MTKRKNDFTMGLETILNNPQTSFLTNPKTFNEIKNQSGMSTATMIKTIGKSAKNNKKASEPTDKEKTEARLQELEAKQK